MRHAQLVVLLLITISLGACSRSPKAVPAVVPTPREVLPPLAVIPRGRGPEEINVDSLLASMSVPEKIGQLIVPWLAGSYVAFDAERFRDALVAVDSFGIGGINVSVGSPLDIAAKLNVLQRRSRLPLLIAADLEWGSATRLIGGTAFPMPMAVGATGREIDAYEMGRITALEARAVGIHLTFSPVADVNNNPDNPIINTRSFGEDPHTVSELVTAYIHGASQHGLLTTAKHFPGHGDTETDSHIAMPVIRACWDRLDSLELIPFRAAITAGVTAVMTAHIALPCLHDTDSLPATLSPLFLTDVLRDSLGFEGIAVTDALIMGAIVSAYGAGESAVRAFLAGSDILLMPADIGEALDAMVAAVNQGRITTQRLDRSVRRLLRLKAKAGLFSRRTVSLDSVQATVGKLAFQEIADDLAQRALTLVRKGRLEEFRRTRGRVALITYAEGTNLTVGNVLVAKLRELGDSVTGFRLYPASGPASYDSARVVIQDAPRVVFASSVRPISWLGHIALPESLAALILEVSAEKPTVLASFGSPYLLHQLPEYSETYLLAWSDVPATERAVANALSGGAAISGRLPITLSDSLPRGYGIEIPGR